jgi:hypothetical protein
VPISSIPSNRADPETEAPRVSPAMVCVATLLPEPDSPTMASVLPRSTSKESPRTAWTTPSGVLNETLRSRTSSRAMALSQPPCLPAASQTFAGSKFWKAGM